MKTVYLLAALAAVNLAAAQQIQKLKNLKSVAISGDVSLTLIKANENRVELEDDEEMQIEYKDNSLSISGDGSATLYYKDGLESIAVGVDSQVRGTDKITAKTFNIAAGVDSEVNLNLDVKSLNLAASTDSEVTLSGTVKELSAAIATDAEFNGESLMAENVNISVQTDGEAIITAKGNLVANVGTDGELVVYGNPKKVDQTKGEDAEITIVR